MDKQAKEARKMAKDLPLKERIAYIWMYYKWCFIGIAAAVLVIGVTIYQKVTAPTYDLEISYYSTEMISDEVIGKMEEYFAQFAEDTDGDGEKTVKIYNTFMSMAGNDPSAQMAVQTKFMAELTGKTYPVFIIGGDFYDAVGGEAADGALEEMRDMAEVPELKQMFEIPDGSHVYWGTRALYPAEEDKQERIEEYNRTKDMETEIFGERK